MNRIIARTLAFVVLLVSSGATAANEIKAIHIFSCEAQLSSNEDGIRKVDIFLDDFKFEKPLISAKGLFKGREKGFLLTGESNALEDGTAIFRGRSKSGEKAIVLTIRGEPNFGKITSSSVSYPTVKTEMPIQCRMLDVSGD